ncbi:MAG: aminotransferase class III-fold pyridoxal phosphate-dependent enzyme [Pseudomonadota bacterium]|nr:aminotransferase class III-fold pyridoxal phosphate-dependent enzyme [Pseudomonadota bacterium]
MQKILNQTEWMERANQVLPGGGFGNFDPSVFISHGKGSRIWDEDGTEYVDYLIGSGPMLIGHSHPEVEEVILSQLSKGTTFFANNVLGVELAEEICRSVACAEQIRYVSTGGEADMYSIRLARAYTKRQKIVKFEGGYHGMCAEAQMSLAPTTLSNFPQAVPDSAGIPESVKSEVLIAPFNDIDFIENFLSQEYGDIAAIIVEPLQRLIPPIKDFLPTLRKLCDKFGILLIFDEVVTGYRFAYGGAQEHYGVTPDICTLGKIIGGGFPLAAIAGRREIMAHFDKSKVGSEGFLMQIGTLSGNPIASIAGLKTLEILRRPGSYEKLRDNGQRIMDFASKNLTKQGIDHKIVGDQTLFEILFTNADISNYRDVQKNNMKQYDLFHKVLKSNAILKPIGKMYVSLALTEEDLAQTEMAIEKASLALAS